jgi:hypothetical protein
MRLSWKVVTPSLLVLAFLAWLALKPKVNGVHISIFAIGKPTDHLCDVPDNEWAVYVNNKDQLGWTPDLGHTYTVVFDSHSGSPVGSMTVHIPSPASTVTGVSHKEYVYTINDSDNVQCKNADPKVILR